MKIFTIFGDPVSHSRSPLMHNHLFHVLRENACYTRTQLSDGTLLRHVFFEKKLDGANVTVPHKEIAYSLCDEVRGIANEIGAVNTLINENGRLIGYNTDADGFLSAIRSFGALSNVLILGAGGTARALSIVLRHHQITPTLLNRSASRLDYFIEQGFEAFDWEHFIPRAFDMIINTTSAGLMDDSLPLPKELLDKLLSQTKCAVDVIYGKSTPFLNEVKKINLPFKDGSDMLLAQGVLANHLFLDSRYDIALIEPIMRDSFTY